MGIFDLSKTAASNTTIEGVTAPVGAMPPSNVGPMFRAMAAMLKKWQEDTGGAVGTTGSANAYVLNVNSDPYSGAATFADGDSFSFIASFTNTGAATLNVESEGAKAIRKEDDQALLGGEIQSGGIYTVHYDASANSAAGAWILTGTATQRAPTSWTPSVSFETAGNISVAYTTRAGYYIRTGKIIVATYNILTSTFTHTTAAGNLILTALPFTSSNINAAVGFSGAVRCGGIEIPGFAQVVSILADNSTTLRFAGCDNATGDAVTNVGTAHVPTGNNLSLFGSITYFMD